MLGIRRMRARDADVRQCTFVYSKAKLVWDMFKFAQR